MEDNQKRFNARMRKRSGKSKNYYGNSFVRWACGPKVQRCYVCGAKHYIGNGCPNC